MFTPVELDRSRKILMGFEGLQLFKKLTGQSLAKMDYENTDMEDYVPTIFYCGLVHEDKELTLEQTIRLIDEHLGVKGALDMLPAILEETFGKAEDVKNGAGAAKIQKKYMKKIV
jgi:hypothetical protein